MGAFLSTKKSADSYDFSTEPPSPANSCNRWGNEYDTIGSVARNRGKSTNTNIEPPQRNESENGASSSTSGINERTFTISDHPNQTRQHKHRYEEMIPLIKTMIIRDVSAAQILPHMKTCLTEEDIAEVEEERSTSKSVEILLEKIHASDEPGKWKMFLQALEICKYKSVVKALRRESTPDTDCQRNMLCVCSVELRERITCTEIISALLKEEVLSNDDKSEILQRKHSEGDVAAMDLLLDKIPRKHPKWFEKFIKSLKSIGHSDLADKLLTKDCSKQIQAKQDSTDQTEQKMPYNNAKDVNDLNYGKCSRKFLHESENTSNTGTAYNNDVNTDSYDKKSGNEGTTKDETDSENIKALQEKNKKLSSSGEELELQIKELEKMEKLMKENNEKQRKRNSLMENINKLNDEGSQLKDEYTRVFVETKNVQELNENDAYEYVLDGNLDTYI